MEDAVAVRRAAREAVGEVEPEPLHAALLAELEDCSPVPGVMVVAGARAIDGSVGVGALADRAAGVQLVYAGLRVTRRLAADPPWVDGGAGDANLDVLAADILVARGAYLLAGTEASDAAVEVIRSFGRDQTEGEDDPTPDWRLEADVFELAAVAGATAVGEGTPPWLVDWAAGRAAALEGEELPEPATFLAADAPLAPTALTEDGGTPEDGRVPSSGDR